jgi:hypothetical protein
VKVQKIVERIGTRRPESLRRNGVDRAQMEWTKGWDNVEG